MTLNLSSASVRWLLIFDGLYAAVIAFCYVTGRSATTTLSIVAAGACLLIWQLAVAWRAHRGAMVLQVIPNIRMPHYFQAAVQGCHYIYLGLYYEHIVDYLPMIVVQLVTAYLLEMLLSWSRGRAWQAGFGPFPVIGSINLFLWFKPEYFYCQLLLVTFAALTKEFVRWDRDGRSSHIFNPSAIALAATAVILLAADATTMTTGVNHILAYEVPPNFFEVMFLFGLLLQVFFSTTLITLGAVIALSIIFYGGLFTLGEPLLFFIFHINVFLGLNLLATDPATSPRPQFGKFLFGLTWGTAIWCCYIFLSWLELPSYYDKILTVPIVNLMVPLFDRIGHRVRIPFQDRRFVYIALYIGLFNLILPRLKTPDDESDYHLKGKLPRPVAYESWKSLRLHRERDRFCTSFPRACEPWGLLEEIRHYREFGSRSPD